jgi:hypothetical protein
LREVKLTAKTSDTDDTDSLSWSSSSSDQGGEDGQTGAEHGSGILRLECLGDGEDELLVGSDSGGVASLGDDTVG